jgi:hypothetical protein
MSDEQPVRPGYGAAAVVHVADAINGVLAGADRPDWLPEVVTGARAVVLFVLDGLGWTALRAHAGALPTLTAAAGGPITTVVPSTTAAALTSITTGVPPAVHGIVGYRFRVAANRSRDVLNVLAWTVGGGELPDPARYQKRPAFGGRRVPVVHRAEFRGSGFTKAHLAGVDHVGWRVPSNIPVHCRALVAAGHPFVYAYYDGIDKVAHEYGVVDGFFRSELATADHLYAQLLDALPDDVAVVTTADHGQIQWGREGWLEVGDLWGLCAAAAGDARFRYLYALDGAADELLAGARERFGEVAWVFSREQLADEGWLGPVEGDGRPPFLQRVGDVVLAGRAPVAFVDPGFVAERGLIAGHGSLTADEMIVPLLAARGRG